MALRGAVVTGVAALLVTIVSVLVLNWPPMLEVAVAAFLIAGVAFVALRKSVVADLGRAEEAVARIEQLVRPADQDQVLRGDSEMNELDSTDEIVDRLERSADSVAARLTHLKRIENYRQEFLGDVSHELQTPIFAVQGFAETLLEGALEDPAVNRTFVEKILRHSERLSSLVNDLAHIAQIETGSLKMDMERFDPGELAADTIESLEMTAATRGVELYEFIGSDVGWALGDRMRIRQVLENLITNGIKYNEERGRVEVTVRVSEEGRLLFSVTDDGIGLAPEHFDRVTERFFRVDRSRSRERGGTGLGLAIVKHILEAHGSALRINSELGRGSTFSFELDSADSPSDTEHL